MKTLAERIKEHSIRVIFIQNPILITMILLQKAVPTTPLPPLKVQTEGADTEKKIYEIDIMFFKVRSEGNLDVVLEIEGTVKEDDGRKTYICLSLPLPQQEISGTLGESDYL